MTAGRLQPRITFQGHRGWHPDVHWFAGFAARVYGNSIEFIENHVVLIERVADEGDAVDAIQRAIITEHLRRRCPRIEAPDLRVAGVADIERPVGPDHEIVAQVFLAGKIPSKPGRARLQAEATQRAARSGSSRTRINLAGPERIAGRIGQHEEKGSSAIGTDVDENLRFVRALLGAVDFRASRAAEDQIAIGSNRDALGLGFFRQRDSYCMGYRRSLDGAIQRIETSAPASSSDNIDSTPSRSKEISWILRKPTLTTVGLGSRLRIGGAISGVLDSTSSHPQRRAEWISRTNH